MDRRAFLGSGLLLGVAGCSRALADVAEIDGEAPVCPPRGLNAPLAQSYTIAARIPDDGKDYFMHDPGMTVLPDGAIFVAAPCWTVAAGCQRDETSASVFLSRSDDGGRTWTTLPPLDGMSDATPFVHDGALYMFLQTTQFGALLLVKSVDRGQTWSAPTTLFDAHYWNCSTPIITQNGKLYWVVQQGPGFRGDVHVIAADLSKDLLDASAWQTSAPLAKPATPWGLAPTPGGAPAPSDPACAAPVVNPYGPGCSNDWWLEPNLVSVRGKLRVILRTIISNYATASLPIVCDVVDDAQGLRLSFAQFYPAPGGQNKCFIVSDPGPGAGDAGTGGPLFWMLSNLPADAQGTIFDWEAVDASRRFLSGPGNDRRFLMLSYSVDALNWFPAGCVARAGLLRQSFMYPSAAIDGDDLVLVSRTSVNGCNQHNADLVTFHRVTNFRSLAMNLYPDAEG